MYARMHAQTHNFFFFFNINHHPAWKMMFPWYSLTSNFVHAKKLRNIQFINLTFVCPCIASISLKYNQQDATFSLSIYFYKLLYMFQAVPLPTIASTKLYIQRQVLSKQYCCLLLSWMIWKSWWWAEELPETRRAIYRNKQIEKNVTSCWLYFRDIQFTIWKL
jgi:hypothetical protein